ncbi:hypothetical protein DVU_1733 [Nitratidesulfovibrio vulgaris str. Hildenborough]|uniref:Uncharacterized protein n=1 Tax=Nitratidesulfovibrio vulgaris (strain ATCC 29579 / DSM 644 / CCUG 34227 / NCIMB 8303 / VKM B-1760 / Hildenborough) TaxID=882 RepID=Q72BA3_NITV2|nr:hypothetical protein DVU_1733 [Nitratidesulfovibrio vulgaris str. Hildenborough]
MGYTFVAVDRPDQRECDARISAREFRYPAAVYLGYTGCDSLDKLLNDFLGCGLKTEDFGSFRFIFSNIVLHGE